MPSPYCPVPTRLPERIASGWYRMDELGLEKWCNRCKDYWPADTTFWFAARGGTGLHAWCKACNTDYRHEVSARVAGGVPA